MKNVFKKAVSLTVALSTVAALSVSAFAETSEVVNVAATYNANATEDAAANSVAINLVDAGYATKNTDDAGNVTYTSKLAAGQYAVAIVPAGEPTYTDDMIFYVNQADEDAIITILAEMLVKGETLPADEYEVRIGNNVDDNIQVHKFTVSSGDYITSTDTNKGTIKSDITAAAVAVHKTSGMGAAAGCKIISLALDTTAYPNAGAATPAYSIAVVGADGKMIDTDGNGVDDVKIFYSAERAKYVAVIPSTITDYKFEVVANGATNEVIKKYGNIIEDAAGMINALDVVQFQKIFKKTDDSLAVTNVKSALIADVTGDGNVNALDVVQFQKAFKKQTYTFAVLNK